MSPRAACRLEELGFGPVYDYTPGIADWAAAGLALEGEEDPGLRVADATRPDIPTAAPDDLVGDVHERATALGWEEVFVVDCDGLLIGRIRGEAWNAPPTSPVDEIMEPGPTTVRPDGGLHSLVERMNKRGTHLVAVTDPQGALIGAVLREDAARLGAGEDPEHVWRDCEGCPGRWASVGAS